MAKGRPPIPDEHIKNLFLTMKKYPKAKGEEWKYYAHRISDKSGVGKEYHERTLQAILYVEGNPDKYRRYTAKRNHRVNKEAKENDIQAKAAKLYEELGLMMEHWQKARELADELRTKEDDEYLKSIYDAFGPENAREVC